MSRKKGAEPLGTAQQDCNEVGMRSFHILEDPGRQPLGDHLPERLIIYPRRKDAQRLLLRGTLLRLTEPSSAA